MALQFIQDENAPEGLGRVIDPDTGLDRVVYDPELARQFAGQQSYQPEPPRALAPQEHLRAEGPPAPPPLAAPGALPPAPEPDSWAAAQTPSTPLGPPRATGAPPPPPAAPGGTVLQKAKVEPGIPGVPYDKAAEEARGADLLDRTLEQDRRASEVDMVLNEQQIELQRQKEEAKRREEINAERSARYEKELDSTVRQELNQDRLQQNAGLFGSILGMLGQTLGYLAKPGSGMFRLQQDLDRRVQRDIEAQKEKKDSMINMLTKKLGSAQQAENHYRAQVNAFTADLLENRLGRLGLANQYSDKIQAMRDQAMAYNEAAKAASFGKPGTAEYTFERPKPEAAKGPAYTNETLGKLKGMGIDEKRYRDGLGAKTATGQTVAQSADAIKQIDADVNTLQALAAANGGDLQGREVIQIPEFLIPKLAQLGIESGMQREQVNQLLQNHLISRAKSYGGEMTRDDLAAVQKEIGNSFPAYLRFLNRQRVAQNNGVRTALEQEFPGRGQQVFDLLLGGSSKNVGVPQVKPEPFEKRNAPDESEGVVGAAVRTMNRNRQAIFDWFSDQTPISTESGRDVRAVMGIDDGGDEKRRRLEAEAEAEVRRRQRERFLR